MADDFTADHLTINASATIAGPSVFNSTADFNGIAQFHAGASFDIGVSVNGNLAVSGNATFGTLYSGLQNTPTIGGSAFTVSVFQGLQEVQVPYTIDGYYQDGYITVDDYGVLGAGSGYWQAQYTWGIVSGQTYGPYYDEEGNVSTPEYNDYQYGYIYSGDQWVDTSSWGVIGSHMEAGQVWVPPSQSFYTDYQYGVPKIQFTAARSDANWAWQVPGTNGVPKDIMLLWDGGLRLPSSDPNRMMALMPDSLTQSYQQLWDGNQERTDSSELKLDGLKSVSNVRQNSEVGEVRTINTTHLRSDAATFTSEEQMGTTAKTIQTQISAKSANFGGVVQVQGDLSIKGVLRVFPAGDLSMEGFTNGPQP